MSDRPVLRRDRQGLNEIPEVSLVVVAALTGSFSEIGQLYADAGQPLYYRKRSLQKIGKRFTSDLLEYSIASPDQLVAKLRVAI
jgi:hypothetical protein